MATTMEIIQGISQAVANKHDGSREDQGKGDFQKIGLRREEPTPFNDRRLIDGFGVSIGGHQLKLHYQSEIALREVYEKKFEDEITDILEQCISFVKKEYRKITKKGLVLKMVGEPVIRVEHMNKIRSWITAYCIYDIEGLEKPEDETYEKRIKATEKYWNNFDKGKK